ncbi:dynamin family protein [endosymbiont of unidentified scaly snail isolate Monju]|uniref:dynamin family protein n=1 Tax=endosymbiont of unidentified scaly snail isolate Monju TaxID=1248727 RepID=UPI0003891B46|nr:dynamin family protein [endosymbiont of unidentified scaly snail isolate Monju]BAN68282.1 conserved hypothetical protein [endosymbiont of unidentified scaly snail isolate Monju]
MAISPLEKQLAGFARWKQRQRKILDQLEPWLQQQNLYSSEIHHAIGRARAALRNDDITVAITGEFSRGKTELINALFFGNLGYRLLPTDAGRTTMCPTEILQDPEAEPCLRLLPIETRGHDISLFHLRQKPELWTTIPLQLDDPDVLEEQLKALTATKRVPRAQAAELGLFEEIDSQFADNTDDTVVIPRWRLAQLNIRHPLLAKGLRVIDTPGLNAVGNEPELTYEILPNAQAILLVLSADTGVTRSDLDIWQQCINPAGQLRQGVMVVLNKVDVLWDDLRPQEHIEERVLQQRSDVANMLDIRIEQTFAVSAQKALLARIRENHHLERRSGIHRLEDYLSTCVVENRRDLIMNDFTGEVQHAIESLENIIESRHKRTQKQIHSLHEVANRSDSSVAHLLRETQRDKKRYQASVEAYRESRREFQEHGRILLEALDLHSLDKVIEEARLEMSKAWTTPGLKEAMRILFDDINARMETVGQHTAAMRRLIRGIYRRFQTDHDFPPLQPAMFSIVRYQVELGMLHQEAEVFRKSPRTTMTEQHFVVKRYFRTIVDRARHIFREAHREAREWLEHALDPLTVEVKEYRGAISQQIRDLKHASQSRKTIQQRILLMEREARRLQIQLSSLQNVRQALNNPIIPNEQGKVRPKVIEGSNDSRLAR